MAKEKLSTGEIIAEEMAKAKVFAELGMYKYFTEEEFPNLAESDLETFALLVLLALKTRYSDITDVASMIVEDEVAYKILIATRDRIEEMAKGVAKSFCDVPKSLEGLPPMFLGEMQEREEIEWYIDHGLPDLINVKNVGAIAMMGDDNIKILKLMAERKRRSLKEDLKIKSPVGLNGNDTK